MVSHMVKQALLNIAKDTNVKVAKTPASRPEWAKLAQDLGIKVGSLVVLNSSSEPLADQVIHIAERDTQVSPKPKELGEFVNTWSIDGFISEGVHQVHM